MNREIKFRVWNIDMKVMSGNWYALNCLTHEEEGKKALVKNIVMQFTGLHDKNGKEIYEGDIVEYKHQTTTRVWGKESVSGQILRQVNQVMFDLGAFKLGYSIPMYGVKSNDYRTRGENINAAWEDKNWDFEIIGNIYENPELLTTPK